MPVALMVVVSTSQGCYIIIHFIVKDLLCIKRSTRTNDSMTIELHSGLPLKSSISFAASRGNFARVSMFSRPPDDTKPGVLI